MLSVPENKQEEEAGEPEEPQEPRGVKRKISLTRCDVCEAEEAKYRCPNCLKFSCSLSCVKQHKHESGCSGVRDKTAFLRLSQFSEINLLNDYRFLEETARVADKPSRDSLLHINPQHSTTVKLVRRNAVAAKVDLKILPKSFTRRKENTSIYIKVERKLYWHLKLHFPQSSAQYTDRVPEDQLLEQILSNYIHPTESDPVKRQRLKLYVLSPPGQLCVFMKSEQRQPGSLRYHELDVKKSLHDNLMFKTVVEYPELYVVLNERCQEYRTRFPERKSVVKSSDLSVSSSRDDPEPTVVLKQPEKRRKCMVDESELEEGEIRSEKEEEGDEDELVHSVGHAKEQKSTDTDRNPPHKDESSDDEDDDDGDNAEDVTMETNRDLQCDNGGDDDGDGQVDGVDNADVAIDQKVTMETNSPLPHDQSEQSGDEGRQGGVDSAPPLSDQKVTMVTDSPLPPGQSEQGCGADSAAALKDQKVTMVTDCLPSSAHDQNTDHDGGDGHQSGATDNQK
ncbi:putative box C/D snoRNA protein SPCC613.07 [Pygocentrus nattereri]|uniref:Box C/D snoRNA protein 1 n=1 Tax=Pygocentrus nattereri TaxID=42514 RepID=A0A3B4BTJ5_PYGNA|nr:putative box C/D snoRNA protein SPCC613.07 [Pygocentrus nattereri]